MPCNKHFGNTFPNESSRPHPATPHQPWFVAWGDHLSRSPGQLVAGQGGGGNRYPGFGVLLGCRTDRSCCWLCGIQINEIWFGRGSFHCPQKWETQPLRFEFQRRFCSGNQIGTEGQVQWTSCYIWHLLQLICSCQPWYWIPGLTSTRRGWSRCICKKSKQASFSEPCMTSMATCLLEHVDSQKVQRML